jgi:glycolate oxidase iron-sulfur subunit
MDPNNILNPGKIIAAKGIAIMASMEALARLMRELEDQLVVCMRCGMCQSVCPVFDQTGREADVARGKLALLSGLMERCSTIPKGFTSG